MVANQYVNERSVPMFANPLEWNIDNKYDPLTIVMHLGSSYTSKKAVPIGTEITNAEYWVITGNYNAQIEQNRTNVNELTKTVTSVKSTADSAKTAAEQASTDASTAKSTADSAKTAAEQASTDASSATTKANEAKASAESATNAANEAKAATTSVKSDVDNIKVALFTPTSN